MIDRIWSYWQLLELESRYSQEELNGGDYGHITWTSIPESRKAEFGDVIEMGYTAERTMIGDVVDTVGGPFCYLYL
jgi:tyrosinase